MTFRRTISSGLVLAVLAACRVLAQEPAGRFVVHPLFQAIPILTVADPIPANGTLAELRIAQPIAGGSVRAWRDRLGLSLLLNGEGITLESGELGLGDWGEGFIDRRHPHTYLHEAMLSLSEVEVAGSRGRALGLGMALGKGFVPFGTDDPMSRPPLRYPVNHHWSQVLERAVLMAQTGYRWVVLEGALFNGDEPEHPSSWPNLSRFGDSWSLRGLVHPTPWMEVQVSRAHVHSPEHRGGAGLDQEKWSTSVRAEGNLGTRPAYGLLEWARTDEASGAFRFESLLGEGAIGLGPVRPYMRIERTERPEEERVSPFHSRRPVIEDGLVGISRWTSVTAGVSVELLPASRWSVAPVLESTIGHIEKVGGGIFEVTSWYERPTFWSLSIGVRAGLGMKGHRMGRYGLLRAQEGHGHR